VIPFTSVLVAPSDGAGTQWTRRPTGMQSHVRRISRRRYRLGKSPHSHGARIMLQAYHDYTLGLSDCQAQFGRLQLTFQHLREAEPRPAIGSGNGARDSDFEVPTMVPSFLERRRKWCPLWCRTARIKTVSVCINCTQRRARDS